MSSSTNRKERRSKEKKKPMERLQWEDELALAQSLVAKEPQDKTKAASYFRHLFMREESNVTCEQLTELLPSLLGLLEEDSPEGDAVGSARLDVAWAITNAVCFKWGQCHVVIQQGGLPVLLRVARSAAPGSSLRLQCLWAIANVAVDCNECRRAVKAIQAVELLSEAVVSGEFSSTKHITTLAWITMNIVRCHVDRTEPQRLIPLEAAHDLVSGVSMMLDKQSKNDIIKNLLWVLAHLADDGNGGVQVDLILSRDGLLNKVFNIFNEAKMVKDHVIMKACLRVIGNICVGTDAQTSSIVHHEDFYELLKFSLLDTEGLRAEAAWICSNVAAGTVEHIEVLFTDDDVFHEIMVGAMEGDSRVKKECQWSIVNLFLNGSQNRTSWLISTGVIIVFPALLSSRVEQMVQRTLVVLARILSDYPQYIGLVVDEKMLDQLDPRLAQNLGIQQEKDAITRLVASHDLDDGPEQTYYFT